MADPRPFLPSDMDPSKALVRAAMAHLLKQIEGRGSAEEVALKCWPRDVYTRAATSPITTSSASALMPAAVGGFIDSLRPASAGAALIGRGLRVDLSGRSSMSIPRPVSITPLGFVGEAAPIPVVQRGLTSTTVGPATKISGICVVTAELQSHSLPTAEAVVTSLLGSSATLALDSGIFSNSAASSARPAGILAGIASLAPATGTGLAAMTADLQAMAAAISDAGGGAELMIFANPKQAVSLKLLAPAGFDYPVIATAALPAGTVVMVDPGGFVSAFDGTPLFETGTEAVLHFDDAPLQIGVPGSPPTIAAPSRSLYQTDSHGVRVTLKASWAMAAPTVAWVQAVTW